MKYFAAVLVCLSMLLATGCKTIEGQSDFNSVIAKNEVAIRITSNLAATGVLVAVKPEQRVETARLMYEVAKAIYTAVEVDGTINLDDVKVLVSDLINSSKDPNRIIVGGIVNTTIALIQTTINSYVDISTPDQRLAAIRTLIRSTSGGVMDATIAFRNGNPTPSNNVVALKVDKSRIRVKHFDWN